MNLNQKTKSHDQRTNDITGSTNCADASNPIYKLYLVQLVDAIVKQSQSRKLEVS